MSNISLEQQTAIMELGQIDVLIEMFGTYLIQEPWKKLDKNRIEKMENAFYLLQEQFSLKKNKIVQSFNA